MPSGGFFRRLGLFVIDDFLSLEDCKRLCSEMSDATSEAGTIVREGASGLLDENTRRVRSAKVPKDTWLSVREQLSSIEPLLEQHFKIALDREFHGPDFLIYREGGFYTPHRDTSSNSPDCVSERRVSAVIFLNGSSEEPKPGSFGGVALTFHGLIEEPGWQKCAFDLDPNAGLLIAFRSDIL